MKLPHPSRQACRRSRALRPCRLLRLLALTAPLLALEGLGTAEDPRAVKLKAEAVEHYRARRYFQAIRSAEAALEVAPDLDRPELKKLLARFRGALGVELLNAGESLKAEGAFREALAEEEDSYARFGLGILHYLRGEDEKALEHLQEAAHLDPSYAKTHEVLALIDYRQGRTSAAITRIKEAFSLDPKDRESKALMDRWQLENNHTGSFQERDAAGFHLRVDPQLPAARVDEVIQGLAAATKIVREGLALGEFPGGPRPGGARTKLVVVLFQEKLFWKATGSRHWVGGVFDGQVKLPVKANKPDAEAVEALRTAIVHELVHVAIREISPECPNWLNEGLAQHFEKPGQWPGVREQLRERSSQRISFRSVPARLWEVDDEGLARWSYLQGLGFVEFLAARFEAFRLRLCLDSIRSERSVSRAFELTYGATIEDLEVLWWKEIERR